MHAWADGPVCHIVGAGQFCPQRFTPREGDLVIAADAGYGHLQRLGVTPDLVVGDFDSLGEVPSHPHVERLPKEKDDTDLLHAVKRGLELGFRRFVLHGATGGERFDHTVANMQSLYYLAVHGARGWIAGEGSTVMTVLCNDTLSFSERHTGYLSVFALGGTARGVTLEGVKYPLAGAVLSESVPLGVSNEFLGRPARVAVEEGALLLIWKE